MKIEAIEIARRGPDRDRLDAWVKIGDEIAIEIQGVGTGEYRWQAHSIGVENGAKANQDVVDAALNPVMGPRDEEGYFGPNSFGVPGVYLEPKTFAHAVYDVFRNA